MIKRTIIIFTFCFCGGFVSAGDLEYSHLVTKGHPLFMIEAEVGKQNPENPHNFERFAIDPAEGIEETYRNLLLLRRCHSVILNTPGKKHLEKIGPLLHFLHSQLEIAHNKYPESAPIAAFYSWSVYRIRLFGDQLPHLESVGIITPYIQEIDRVPAIPRTMFAIFNLIDVYVKDHHYEGYSKIFNLTDGDPEPKEILELLATYWASKIDPAYSVRWTKEMVAEKRAKLSDEDMRRAIRAWRQLVEAYYEVSRSLIRTDIVKERYEQQKKFRGKKRKEYEAMKKKAKEQKRQPRFERLSDLEKEAKTEEELIYIMSHLSRTDDGLESERLPNYEEIKANLGKVEAEVTNAFFLFYVHRDHAEAAAAAERLLKHHPEDIRLLCLMAIHKAREGNLAKAEETAERILEIDRLNRMAIAILREIRERTKGKASQQE